MRRASPIKAWNTRELGLCFSLDTLRTTTTCVRIRENDALFDEKSLKLLIFMLMLSNEMIYLLESLDSTCLL